MDINVNVDSGVNSSGESIHKVRTMIERDRQLYHDRRYWVIRRFQDIVFSLVALILLFPLMLLVALCIFIDTRKEARYFLRSGVDVMVKHSGFISFAACASMRNSFLTDL